jgi:hypothetical protein
MHYDSSDTLDIMYLIAFDVIAFLFFDYAYLKRLFQKRVVRTKLDIYVFILMLLLLNWKYMVQVAITITIDEGFPETRRAH